MIKKLQFYVSHTVNPYINLAVEKYLFDTVESESLILYLWQNQNTVVIGKIRMRFRSAVPNFLQARGAGLRGVCQVAEPSFTTSAT